MKMDRRTEKPAAVIIAAVALAWACGGSDSATVASAGGSRGDAGGESSGAAGLTAGGAGSGSTDPSSSAGKGGAAGGESPPDPVGIECRFEGQVYQDGEGFTAADRCNTCSCQSGNVYCTEFVCPRCYRGVSVYTPDETVEDPDDGCLVCICSGADGLDCSMEPCIGDESGAGGNGGSGNPDPSLAGGAGGAGGGAGGVGG